MRVYTECARCQRILDTGATATNTHPDCQPVTDPIIDAYRAALHTDDQATIDRLTPHIDRVDPPRLGDAAMWYATRYRWPVFPIQPGGKTPATRRGFKDATTDPDRIRAWWNTTPTANIGTPTGRTFNVIDIDAPEGWAAYLAMLNNDALPHVHAVATTPRGGLHLYQQVEQGAGNLAGTLPGVDFRGAGGYVLAPPSVTTVGRYLWRHKPSPAIHGATPQ